jgi:hypothetical protein
MAKRVAFYLRVSTGDGQQTIENQRQALDEIAERAGWQVIEVYADEISGTKGRERRPDFDRMLKAAVHRKFDMIALVGRSPRPIATGSRRLSGRAQVGRRRSAASNARQPRTLAARRGTSRRFPAPPQPSHAFAGRAQPLLPPTCRAKPRAPSGMIAEQLATGRAGVASGAGLPGERSLDVPSERRAEFG